MDGDENGERNNLLVLKREGGEFNEEWGGFEKYALIVVFCSRVSLLTLVIIPGRA